MKYSSVTLLLVFNNLLVFPAFAEDSSSWIYLVNSEPKCELWINPGMYSYHFQKDKNLNSNNLGVGLEYRFTSVASVTVGNFKNSDNANSTYIGIYYQPFAIGPIKLGVVTGGFNGYLSTNNGGWFPAVLPALTVEEGRFGTNIFFIPTVGERVHGAISLQLKIKLYD